MRDSLHTEMPHETEAQARHQDFDPEQIIGKLPEHATPAQQDSAIQTHLPERELFRSEHPDTLNLPGWDVPSPEESAQNSLHLYEKSLFPESPYEHTEAWSSYSGMTAEPQPYLLRNDDGVTGILLCCFLMNMAIFSRSKKYIKQQIQELFYNRTGYNSSGTTTGREMRHTLLLYLQTGLMVALFAFSHNISVCDMFMAHVSHFQLLGVYVMACWLYWGIKQLFYSFVNWTFFDKEQRTAWMKSYSFLVSMEGLLLFPIALVMVYSNLPAKYVTLCLYVVISVVKILLFYKTFAIFFPKTHGFLHLIAYLCALEMLPACVLWKALTFINIILL